jgi:hypothetical protein
MDTVLLAVTILSLAMAIATAFLVAKLTREERARSAARVSTLSAMAAEPASDVQFSAPVPRALPTLRVDPPQPSRPIEAPETRRRTAERPEEPRRTPRIPVQALDDLDLRPASVSSTSVVGVSHLFEETAAPSPWGRRFAVIGALAAVVVAVSVVLASMHSSATAGPTVNPRQQQPAVGTSPLELVSLHHSQEPQRLVITGLVQNPRSGGALSHIVATAFVFGPDGAFLTSSRAPLDFITLSPGDESGFVLNIPVTGSVARYRVGFRTEDGRVIEHVDKRTPDALAQN